jgi:hypothetical protein
MGDGSTKIYSIDFRNPEKRPRPAAGRGPRPIVRRSIFMIECDALGR